MNRSDCSCDGIKAQWRLSNQLAGRQSSGGKLLPCNGIVLKEEMIGGPSAPFAFFFLTVTPASGLSTIRLKATNVATITMIVAAVLMILLILAHSHDVG
jgi:hypothetical protein